MGQHTNFSRGKRVRIYCRDGSYLEGKFIQRTKNKRLILDTGEVHMYMVARAIEIKYEPKPILPQENSVETQCDGVDPSRDPECL